MIFKVLYKLYRLIHRILTGVPVRVGNFLIIPAVHLSTLTVSSEMWNHYTACVYQTRIPRSTVPTVRGKRLAGLAIPGWATFVSGLILVGIFQVFTFICIFILFTLRSRNNLDFIPIRDYKYFIDGLKEVYPGNG